MRARLALLGVLFALGCASTHVPQSTETRAHLPGSPYVTLPRLAENLDLEYRGPTKGFIELSAPPDHVMFVEDSRRVVVNRTEVYLVDPCVRLGREFVLTQGDAALVTQRFVQLRTTRAAPVPRVPAPLSVRPPAGSSTLPANWRPKAGVTLRSWQTIVIHHMAAPEGSAAYIHRLHRERGWDGLGYHFVIGNGTMSGDGEVELGYRWTEQLVGAHARAGAGDDNRWNLHGIGICLIGDFTKDRPSRRQMESLVAVVRALRAEYGIAVRDVVPHSHVRATECPGPKFPWNEFIDRIR